MMNFRALCSGQCGLLLSYYSSSRYRVACGGYYLLRFLDAREWTKLASIEWATITIISSDR